MSAAKEFRKVGTKFKPGQNVDKREIFMKEVEPLVRAAVEKIKELGLPFVFGIGTAYKKHEDGEEDGEISTLTAYGHGDDQFMPPSLGMAAIALDLDHTGCLSCFVKEAIHCNLIKPDAKIELPKDHPVTESVKAHIASQAMAAVPASTPSPEQLKDLKDEFFGKN